MLEEIKNKLEELILKLTRLDTNLYQEDDFHAWKLAFLNAVELRVPKLQSWATKYNNSNRDIVDLLQRPAVIKYIKFMKKHFVFVPIDKAGSMFAIICKSFYIKVIKEELQLKKGTQGQVYVPMKDLEDAIISAHVETNRTLSYTLPAEEQKLPVLYWTPKFHKNPVGFRFISASSHCTTQHASVNLTHILRCVQTTVHKMATDYKKKNKVNWCWIINNSKRLLYTIRNINDFAKAKSVSSYDFERLYTNIPLDMLYSRLRTLIYECSHHQKSLYFHVNKKYTRWSNNTKDVSIPETLLYLKFALDNTYVSVGDRVFHQTIGIPMGTNCAPLSG